MIEQRRIYAVSELNDQIRGMLEKSFSLIWISGEVSNFRKPGSGHYYFTLKDSRSQIAAVMFRAQTQNLKFELEDGHHIVGLGRISVYEPRGVYQIILEYLEPKGIGSLQIAYEQLKLKLADDGLFDDIHKQPLPFLPDSIAVITSPTGAVIHDILHIVTRRFPGIPIEIVPVRVQGDQSVEDIERALNLVNGRRSSDVIILARGGGSLEDLQAFNSERVARAVFASRIPVISAIGHETDFTITDFVADFRASTPSAAAEQVVPLKSEWQRRCSDLTLRLTSRWHQHIDRLTGRLSEINQRLVHPQKRIQNSWLRLDELSGRMIQLITARLRHHQEHLTWRTASLQSAAPRTLVGRLGTRRDHQYTQMVHLTRGVLARQSSRLRELAARLHSLSPLSILSRGYSIARTIPGASIIRHASDVAIGQNLEVLLADGLLVCRVERIAAHAETNI